MILHVFACISLYFFCYRLLFSINGGIKCPTLKNMPDSQKHARFAICIRADEVDLYKN